MRNRVTSLLLQTQMNVLRSCAGNSECLKILSMPIREDITIPAYYRGLARNRRLHGLIERLLENNLVFNVNSQFEAGRLGSVGTDNFYCATLDDEELPWDISKTDDCEVSSSRPSKKRRLE